MRAPDLPGSLALRFEGIVFDWDGTAVTDRSADASAVRGLVETLCARGVDVAIVSGTHLENIDNQLGARPAGPGRLLMAVNRGSELFEVGAGGARLLARREATPGEDAALTRAADATVAKLAAKGLEARVVSQRLNRRKIDLIPVPEWADPPKARIDDLLAAVEQRLHDAGIRDLAEVAALAVNAAREAGLADPRVTSDAKHVEIGLTDKTDSARAVLAELWSDGIAPEQIVIGGDEFGTLGGMPGSDSLMMVAEARGAPVFSVGVEPNGVPAGVVHLAGGPARFLEVLADQVERRREVPRVAERGGWCLVVDAFDPVDEEPRAAMLTIADGVIGTRGAPLFAHPAVVPEVMAAGVYDGEGPTTDLLAAPVWSALPRALAPDDRVRRVLDLRNGLLGERVTGATPIESVRFTSLARPGVAVLRADAELPEEMAALAPPHEGVTRGSDADAEWMATCGPGSSITAAAAQAHDAARIDRVAAYVIGDGAAEPERALAALRSARAEGFDGLLAEQRRAWSRRWDRAEIRIEGDDRLQLGVRFALFHLMASVATSGEAAVGARGMTGHAYRGHVFWDADLFVLPFLAATEPAAARAMIEYRYRRLPAALAAARAEGRSGARFPWESAATGYDVTPRSVHNAEGHVVPIRTGEAEAHIVGDVAWGVCCYVDWTGDEAFAVGPGREILVETARYWASRIRVDHSGRGHIYGVIGPDEYHEPVDDNAFTNVLARWNLRRAAEIARADPSTGGLEIDDAEIDDAEIEHWLRLADAIVDGFDPATGIYEEFAGFFGLEPLIIRDIAPKRPIVADLFLSPERVHGAQIVKQTDVLMLHHLIPDEVEAGTLRANLDYYEPRTAHGSSLSPGIHAALLARAGRIDDALAMLAVTAGLDTDNEVPTGEGGVHLAAMGSLWHALAYGFAGLRPGRAGLVVDPRLPAAWPAFEIRVEYRRVPVHLRVEPEAVVVHAADPVVLVVDGRSITCAAGETRITRPNRRAHAPVS